MQENGGCEVDLASTATSADHLLTESSISLGAVCRVCGRPMLGLLRQGFLCQSTLITRLSPLITLRYINQFV